MKRSAISIILFVACSMIIQTVVNAMEAAPPTGGVPYPVRVAVAIDEPAVTLEIKGNYIITALPLSEKLMGGRDLAEVEIKPGYSGIFMDGKPLNIYGVKIKAEEEASIRINNRAFRGELDIIRTENIKLLAINKLDLEDYIKGVLYHEVSHWWPMATLKAQAIAARTFAICKVIESKNADFDLRSDVYSQVYGGRTSERYRTTRAVDETRGKILVYRGKIIPAYYHATCGGHTEDASRLWKTEIFPLKGRPCNYCRRSPHYAWSAELSLGDIEKRLGLKGYRLKGVEAVEILSRNDSGRVETVAVKDTLGIEKIPSNKFRLALGPNLIKSTNFSLKRQDGKIRFSGKGWGHGVGMCQWGAYFMARRGLGHVDILRFYYPGSGIVKLEDTLKE